MPGWPKTFHRKTKHAKPQSQLYQPGFNNANGCWLDGSWITLPEAEWKKRKAGHDKMYRAARKAKAKQHHQDNGVKPEDMTKAQRQAWEHLSGTAHFDVIWPNGHIGPIGVDMAGKRLTPTSERWLRGQEAKIFKWVVGPDKKKPAVNQLKDHDIPKEFISIDHGTTKKTPVDTWQNVVDQNVANFDAMFYSCVEALEKNEESESQIQFAAMTAFHRLIEVEEGIIRMEWHVSKGQEADEYQTIEGETKRYVKLRKRLKEAIKAGGYDEPFDELLADHKKSHNECARANLDNSDGQSGGYVLPKFKEDGTHEPWGERDVPWNWVDPWADAEEGAAE